jgi:hypothetical protein
VSLGSASTRRGGSSNSKKAATLQRVAAFCFVRPDAQRQQRENKGLNKATNFLKSFLLTRRRDFWQKLAGVDS